MILFYNKKGEIVGSIDGRVHSEMQMNMQHGDNAKFIIGWEEKGDKMIEHNLDKINILEKIENKEKNLFNYKISNNNIKEQ
jgi:hypothetical protein